MPAAAPSTLLALTFVTGIVDATSFLALGGVFSAMMTGNVIFLGFGLLESIEGPVAGPSLAIAASIAASGLAAFMVAGRARFQPGPGAGTVVEIALLASAAIIAAAVSVRSGELSGYVALVLLAFAMGWRGTIVRSLGAVDMPTTVLNLTLIASPAAGAAGLAPGSELGHRAVALAVMLVGALTGGLLLEQIDLWAPLALAATVSCLAALGQLRRARIG